MDKTNNNADNLKILFLAHHSHLCNISARIVKDRNAAKKIVQDVFHKLWMRKKERQSHSGLRIYLYKAVSHASHSYLEKNS